MPVLFLREHRNVSVLENHGGATSLRLLAAGRVDYVLADLNVGIREIVTKGLAGKIEPLLSRSVIEDELSICFNKTRVLPSLVEAFSHTLREFKQTEKFEEIYQKYFP